MGKKHPPAAGLVACLAVLVLAGLSTHVRGNSKQSVTLRSLLAENAWYSYRLTFPGPGPICKPCQRALGSSCAPCMTEDSAGKDDTICMLPEFFGGNLLDNSLCGFWVVPSNIGYSAIVAPGYGVIGELMPYMRQDGTWIGTIRLNCPWMIKLSASESINVAVSANGVPASPWSFSHGGGAGTSYRTCHSVSIPMTSFCNPAVGVISMSVTFVAQTMSAIDADTCALDNSGTANIVVKDYPYF
ncbi:hypothetical protein FOA52_006037 [Chlamydomonas sp. UWO 241]|nr:hypothetical protein FOA52_006037 [Chlamydomonas sp. UWO 241]